ncbi:hypothetical protein L6452_37088 [Arctium lappa]|uniref:Uncharacterized protein n=1 Tax=Arctium lappa TaxID=4217 RepID=A0ACB8Y3J9_ARCLA|nr:hypothetical protein L6452_37088 [Arctium lappa]
MRLEKHHLANQHKLPPYKTRACYLKRKKASIVDTKSDKIEETPGGTKYYVPTVDESLVPKVGDRQSFNNVSTPVKDQNQCEAELKLITAMMFDSSSRSPPRLGFDCAAGRSSVLFASSSATTPPLSPGAFGS